MNLPLRSIMLAIDPIIDPWLQAAIQLGCLGIVAFGAHYVLTKSIPNMQSLFVGELKAQRELHNTTEKDAQKAFIEALTAQRVDFKEMVKDYHATNNAMAERIHDLTKAVVATNCPYQKGGAPK